jgi:CRP/FNR family transcriptional regulator, cyclic AMP receptor protein
MIDRFTGPNSLPRLVEALRQQRCSGGDLAVAEALASACVVELHRAGSKIISQSATDNDVYFILAGGTSVRVNGREVATRGAKQHVGEMALIDPAAPRSADVVAVSDVVAAKVSEAAFTALAELWRILACELGDRLRQRGQHVQPQNSRPRIFVASSAEALEVARTIQAGLDHDPFDVVLWTDDVFKPSDYPLESLSRELQKCDFSVAVLTADDQIISRHVGFAGPRDNVVFELGLFIATVGRHRCFLVNPRGVDLKIPSDLIGVTPLTYEAGAGDDVSALLGPICTRLRRVIRELGPR